ncbi:hypothetical protein BH10CYA1_BH10CYA1_19670 [soil metagenome]
MVRKENDAISSSTEVKSAAAMQSSKNYYLPKIVLCLLGDLDSKTELEEMLNEANVDYEFGERDARMEESFKGVEFGTRPSLKREDFDAISDHSLVLYILSNGYPKASAFQASAWFLLFGCKLLETGAVAMKCESSGISHSRLRWLTLSEACKRHSSTQPEREIGEVVAGLYTALFEAYVQYPIGSAKDYWSCGMHLLGQPDVIIATELVKKALADSDSPVADVAYLFNAFCLYILGESSESHFESGGTFHPDSEFPSLKVVWEECEGYPHDDLYFNPYGRWRFSSISD